MPGRLGPRFAIEALFLIALAAGAAYADLDARWIAAIMAAGWVVVALLELTAERIWAAAPPWRRPNYYASPVLPRPVPAPPEPPEPAIGAVAEAGPAPEPEAEPEAATVIAAPAYVPPAVAVPAPAGPEREPEVEPDAEAEPEVEPEPEPEPEAEEPLRPHLEPLQPRAKRRWFRRGERDEHKEAPLPEVPKHVRLLPVTPERSRTSDEIAEIFDAPEREERSRR